VNRPLFRNRREAAFPSSSPRGADLD
jgi:hypothetical protein